MLLLKAASKSSRVPQTQSHTHTPNPIMGLFSSSKIPQPPLPNLEIILDSDQTYRPDDIVKGHIALTPLLPISPHALNVALFGQSLIWHRVDVSSSDSASNYYHWRDNAPFFEVAEDVLHADHDVKREKGPLDLLPGQTYQFRFEFRLPRGTANSRHGQYKNDADAKFNIGPHDLPPTFLHTDRNGKGTDANYAKIEYGVRATLVCPGVSVVQGKNLADFTITEPIDFLPTCIPSPPGPLSVLRTPKTFVLQSSSLTGQDPSQIGFRQSIRDRFSSSTPSLSFEAAVEMPDHLTSGKKFRFRASFNVLSKSENVIHIPPITFRVLKLDLLDFTIYRAPRDGDADNGRDGAHRSNRYVSVPPPDQLYAVAKNEREEIEERKTHLNSLPDSARLELMPVPAYTVLERPVSREKGGAAGMEQAKNCEAWFSARVPGVTPPNFRSFAITRVYKVRVKLGVEVGGKKFNMEAESNVREMGSLVS
jgi:hypothetical protein